MTKILDPESDRTRLIRAASFGDEVDDFLRGNVGKYVLQCAQADIDESMTAFKSCDVSDIEAVRKLQNKIAVSESIKSWLIEAVASGLQALDILENRRDGNE